MRSLATGRDSMSSVESPHLNTHFASSPLVAESQQATIMESIHQTLGEVSIIDRGEGGGVASVLSTFADRIGGVRQLGPLHPETIYVASGLLRGVVVLTITRRLPLHHHPSCHPPPPFISMSGEKQHRN